MNVKTQIRMSGSVSGSASKTGVVRHEWGGLSTASAAFSLCEGNRVPGH